MYFPNLAFVEKYTRLGYNTLPMRTTHKAKSVKFTYICDNLNPNIMHIGLYEIKAAVIHVGFKTLLLIRTIVNASNRKNQGVNEKYKGSVHQCVKHPLKPGSMRTNSIYFS